MLGRKQIDASSEEWATTDYRIQIITGKSSIQIVNLFAYPCIQSEEFKTEGVLHVTDLDPQYAERAARNSIPSEEMVFYCGHVNIHALIRPSKVFTFLLCKLKLGKIATVQDEFSMADSMLLESDSDREAFQYNFMVRDQRRYQVQYQVHFVIGNEKEFLESEYQCMNCQNRRAMVHCTNEQLNLCEECSKDHHNRRMMNNHDIERIDKVNTLPNCKKHSQQLTLYCSCCCKYLCSICLQKGNSHGANDHPVTDVNQLYMQKKEQTESTSVHQRDKLATLLSNLEIKKEEIQENYLHTKRIIEMVTEKSLRNLSHLYAEKTFLIKSEEIELRMMSQKLQWSKTFIRFQEKNLKPLFYFQSQDKFGHELGKVRVSEFPAIFSLKADLAVEGNLFVGKKEQLDAPLRDLPQSSRVMAMAENDPLNSHSLDAKRSVYEHDPNAETPLRGELALMLDNTQLNFFNLIK